MKRKKIILALVLTFLLNLFPSLCLAAKTFTYTLMEGIPGFSNAGDSPDFPQYIAEIYKLGIWVVGICAMFMIMLGGYVYLTSAGNTSQTGKAKGIITDALAGLVLALVSYLLLYIINPDLVKIIPLKP